MLGALGAKRHGHCSRVTMTTHENGPDQPITLAQAQQLRDFHDATSPKRAPTPIPELPLGRLRQLQTNFDRRFHESPLLSVGIALAAGVATAVLLRSPITRVIFAIATSTGLSLTAAQTKPEGLSPPT
jgi:hypothetical protein